MQDLLIDFTYYQGGRNFHGGGEYGNVILEELLEQSDQINCGVFFFKGKRINKHIFNKCLTKGWHIHPICDIRNIPNILKDYKYRTIYSALPYANRWDKIELHEDVRFIATFHGLRLMELSECEERELSFFENRFNSNYSCRSLPSQAKREPYADILLGIKNGQIIADSEHSKASIYYYFPEIQHKNIKVLYPPLKKANISIQEMQEVKILHEMNIRKREFGLIVSAGIWYKNALRGIKAYDDIFEKNYMFVPETFKVVVLGAAKENQFLDRVKNPQRFIIKSYVNAEQLEILYKNAHLFLYPSLNEGFGYPPLEAMKYNTLCACSANTSITEVCRDMVLYFNPLNIDEIANRILQSFSDDIREKKLEIIKQCLPQIRERQESDLKKIINIIVGEKNG